MKKTLVLLTLAAALSAFSQGSVNFVMRDTSVTPNVNAYAFYTNSGQLGPMANGARPSPLVNVSSGGYNWGGTNAMIGLYGATNGTAEADLVLLVPAVIFRTGNGAGYANAGTNSVRRVAGVPGGGSATLQVRAWDAGTAYMPDGSALIASYENALEWSAIRPIYLGKSLPFNITLGNPDSVPPGTPAPMQGIATFAMDYVGVPEPSIIGLGILGAIAGLMVFRRRN